MIEKVVDRDGERVIEVRSDAGKLLLIKTKKGYEIKCPRTKKVCLIEYEEMLNDCMTCLNVAPVDWQGILSKLEKKNKPKM